MQRRIRRVSRTANGTRIQIGGKEGVEISATSRAELLDWARGIVKDDEYIMTAFAILHHFGTGGTVGSMESLEGKIISIDPTSPEIVTVENG